MARTTAGWLLAAGVTAAVIAGVWVVRTSASDPAESVPPLGTPAQPACLPVIPSEDLATDPAVTSLAADQGIPIEEVMERISWQAQAAPIDAAVKATLGDLYAGLWFDVDNGDRMQVGATVTETSSPSAAEVEAVVDAIAAECGVPDVDLHPAAYSQAELDAAVDWLAARGDALPGDSFTVSADQPGNRVVIKAGPAPERTPALVAFLTEAVDRYGDLVVVTEEEPAVYSVDIGPPGSVGE